MRVLFPLYTSGVWVQEVYCADVLCLNAGSIGTRECLPGQNEQEACNAETDIDYCRE